MQLLEFSFLMTSSKPTKTPSEHAICPSRLQSLPPHLAKPPAAHPNPVYVSKSPPLHFSCGVCRGFAFAFQSHVGWCTHGGWVADEEKVFEVEGVVDLITILTFGLLHRGHPIFILGAHGQDLFQLRGPGIDQLLDPSALAVT